MSAAAMRIKEPSAEHLSQAMRRISRPGWPASLEQCLDHPIYGPCIRGLARAIARQPARAVPTRPCPRPCPPSHALGPAHQAMPSALPTRPCPPAAPLFFCVADFDDLCIPRA